MSSEDLWRPFEEGRTIGETGSEKGRILLDEACDFGRITLEQVDNPPRPYFGITCGIYGWMVHTAFASTETEGRARYAAMKHDLTALIDLIPVDDDSPDLKSKLEVVEEEIARFVERY